MVSCSPWCQRLKPVWDDMANVVGSTVPGLGVGAVDCTLPEAVELCQAQHIQAFPTIQLYAEGIPHSHLSYSGPRTKEALLAWLVRAEQLGDALVTAPDAAHAALVGHEESPEEAGAHAAAREKLLGLMNAPEDTEEDPAAPGGAQALIEALHRAGIHAPGDNARSSSSGSGGGGGGSRRSSGSGASGGGGGGDGSGGSGGRAQALPPPPRGARGWARWGSSASQGA